MDSLENTCDNSHQELEDTCPISDTEDDTCCLSDLELGPKDYMGEDDMITDEEMILCGYTIFEDLRLITITILTYLNIDLKEKDPDILRKIHFLLPIFKIPIAKSTRSVKKVTMIHPDIPYLICNSKYNGDVRGTIKTAPKGKWPTGIMSDMTIHDKFINFKLSKSTINIAGVKNVDSGLDGANKFVQHINEINNSIFVMNENKQMASVIANEVLREGFVSKIKMYSDGVVGFKYNPGYVKNRDTDTIIQSRIRTFFILCLGDIRRYDYACSKLEWVLEREPLYYDDMYITGHQTNMTKYKFFLGFRVGLAQLYLIILEEEEQFYIHYDPMRDDYAKIQIYDPMIGTKGKHKKHGFNIKENGEVTYTSGNIDNSHIFYRYFLTIIDDIRERIELEDED
jgi:hypothetical protein